MLNKSNATIFKEVSMPGRFGKYGDAKRKAQIRKNWPNEEKPPFGIVHILHERPTKGESGGTLIVLFCP